MKEEQQQQQQPSEATTSSSNVIVVSQGDHGAIESSGDEGTTTPTTTPSTTTIESTATQIDSTSSEKHQGEKGASIIVETNDNSAFSNSNGEPDHIVDPGTVNSINNDNQVTDNVVAVVDDDNDDDETDLSNPLRRIWIVTTAAMPWRTGTAVNPLMRALYLTRGRPKHYVTLVIPWLSDMESQQKLFGAGHTFADPPSQEAWIRDFCRTRANCPEEESNLRIMFYSSKYHNTLGSIFPSEDICTLIPDEEADVAILEEPEHLNWFRIPSTTASTTNTTDQEEENQDKTGESSRGVEVVYGKEPDVKERNQLGWAQKFRYVVGILHTNYAAYMGQYGFGTSIIAAPALSLLSSIVVRAYCNRVIRLSAALPPLAPNKEVTCNVHGVRSEFLQTPIPKPSTDTAPDIDTGVVPYAPVYFIGKVIWAKGFDKILEVQELYRQKTGQYFGFDIYGSGSDEKAVRRAFYGRRGSPSTSKSLGNTPPLSPGCQSPPSETKELASKVFQSTESLRGLLFQAKEAFSAAVIRELEYIREDSNISESENSDRQAPNVAAANAAKEGKSSESRPLSVLGDLSGKSVTTGLAVSKAVYKLADKMVKAGMSMTFEKEGTEHDDENVTASKALVFSPPQSRYEWRRTPIPARFRGIIDHVEVRDIAENKIFLNMSTTEVLCTTTAEALAMGKFVILPKHPSNEFFYEFPNCLVYNSIEECSEKLEWALEHDPQPLSNEHIRAFSWEGATDRLFDSARMTADEKKKRDVTDKEDKGVARFHVESMIKGHLLTKFFAGEK